MANDHEKGFALGFEFFGTKSSCLDLCYIMSAEKERKVRSYSWDEAISLVIKRLEVELPEHLLAVYIAKSIIDPFNERQIDGFCEWTGLPRTASVKLVAGFMNGFMHQVEGCAKFVSHFSFGAALPGCNCEDLDIQYQNAQWN